MSETPRQIACVTGATGMIGGKIVPRLLDLGYEVRVLSRRKDFKIHQVESFYGGLEDEAVLENFLQNARLLFHCAAELMDYSKMWEVNVAGTERLLRIATQAGIEFLCHLSSAGVVGRTEEIWVDENTPCQPQNLYERTKLEAEKLVARLGSGCRTVILRPTNVVDHRKPGALDLPTRFAGRPAEGFIKRGRKCTSHSRRRRSRRCGFFHYIPAGDSAIFFCVLRP